MKAEIPEYPSWCNRIEDFEEWHSAEWRWILDKLRNPSVIIIRGTGRSGKTAMAYLLLELAHKMGQTCYMMGGSPGSVDYIEQIESIKDLQNREGKKALLIDDIGAIGLTARNHASSESKYLQQFSTIISHKEITVIISIQNLALLDVKGLMTAQDSIVLHKLSNPFGISLERDWAQHLLEHANDYLHYLLDTYYNLPSYDSKNHEGKGLFYDVNTSRVAYSPLPELYTDEISRSYRREGIT